ncbi:MAG: protein-L-isoaspartate O-methyltransferase, partial [Planctomycetes bacterium]|nr:protein-L-isoaspartate O-methyltransferase [Planctomycetota bacterium]
VTRVTESRFEEEELGGVRFVPLVGAEGWREERPRPPRVERPSALAALAAESCEPFASIETIDLEPFLRRVGDARVVLLGEATHGTSEFYRLRARITRELIARKGFDIVAVEADWPDAARIDHFVRERDVPRAKWQAFARFPTWMWRNRDVRDFVDWLHDHNQGRERGRRVRFAGLDLYGMYNSIAAVLGYLDRAEPSSAALARQRYGCLTPWQSDPAEYGRAALTGEYRSCERDVVGMLQTLLEKGMEELRRDDEPFFEALQNARVVADAEAYYRVMYYGAAESWNLRDRHMFATLERLLEFHGPSSKAVVWEHNSHVGDASATEMAARGELNIGQLCRQRFGPAAYSLGFGTHHGTVAAASHWGGPLEVKQVRPALEKSYERLFHDAGVPSFLLPLRSPRKPELRRELTEARLERAIGVLYRPETERASHYFHAVLPHQFDEFAWFDRTEAVHPIETHELTGMPDTYPFGL